MRRVLILLLATAAGAAAQSRLPFNTVRDEYSPSITADGTRLYFTAQRPGGQGGFDIWYVDREDTGWSEPVNPGPPLNSPLSEMCCCISADGTTMILAITDAPDGYGDQDLYVARLQKDGSWTKPVNLGPAINTSAWESFPSLSRDGRTLYFSSDRGGGAGGIDIYVSRRNADGDWSDARPMASINTPGNDVTPCISLDDSSLYFASDGVVDGKTDLDIYVSHLHGGEWTRPVEVLGVNTPAQELFPSLSGSQNLMFFCSNRNRATRMDIYASPLPLDLSPAHAFTEVNVTVDDADNHLPVGGAQVTLSAAETDSLMAVATSNPLTGEAEFVVPRGRTYRLAATAPDFYMGLLTVAVPATAGEMVRAEVPLENLQLGKPHIVASVFVAGSDSLTAAGVAELRKLATLFRHERTLHAAVFVNNEPNDDDGQLRQRRIERLRAGLRHGPREGSHIDWKPLPFTGESLEHDLNYVVLVPILN